MKYKYRIVSETNCLGGHVYTVERFDCGEWSVIGQEYISLISARHALDSLRRQDEFVPIRTVVHEE